MLTIQFFMFEHHPNCVRNCRPFARALNLTTLAVIVSSCAFTSKFINTNASALIKLVQMTTFGIAVVFKDVNSLINAHVAATRISLREQTWTSGCI